MTTPTNESQPIVLEDRFRDVAAQVLTEARNAASARDDLDREIATENDREKADVTEQDGLNGEQAQLERDLERIQRRLAEITPQLEEIRERRAGRAKWLTSRLSLRAVAAADAKRLVDEGQRAMAVVEQMSDGQDADGEQADDAGVRQVTLVEPEFGSPLATVRDPLPPVEQNGSPA